MVGVLKGVELSFEALEEAFPTLAPSNFLITDAVNLLSSLMGEKFTVDLFLSAVLVVGVKLTVDLLSTELVGVELMVDFFLSTVLMGV